MLNLQEEVDSFPQKGGLIIVRGISGAGKSTFAKKLAKYLSAPICDFPLNKFGVSVFEADDYFIRPDGLYDFNPRLLGNAHDSCFKKITAYIRFGKERGGKYVGILSNTSTRKSEMQRYIDFAKDNDFFLKVYRMVSEYKNTHGVPAETVQKMKDRFEDFEGEILVDQYE
jgi:hypothetical protein